MTKKETEPPYIFTDDFCLERSNMAWRVELGRVDPNNPLLSGKYPWDEASPFLNGTVLKDPIDGLYKVWGMTNPAFAGHKWGEWDFRLGYATSEDGVHWERPMFDGFPCMGHAKSNVLLDLPDGGNMYQMSVLIDPKAEPDRRYELFVYRQPGNKNNPSKRVKGLPLGPHDENWLGEPAHRWGLYRYFSRDGIHWIVNDGPPPLESADSLFVYKNFGAPYVAYHKTCPAAPPGSAYAPHDNGAGVVRIVARRESQDGVHWSDPPLTVVTPDWRDTHDTQFMDLSPTRAGSGYIATVAVFHALNQTMDIQFAGSRDGKNWFRPIPRVPCVPNGSLGDPGGGHIFQSHSMVEDGDKLHLYYFGAEGLHADLYKSVDDQRKTDGQLTCYPTGGLCRASWERGRLWSVVPSAAGPSEAVATARPIPDCAGKTLYINALCLEGGEIAAELVTGNEWDFGPPVEGYRREDCQSFHGDSKCVPLTWKGRDKCPKEGLLLRFYIRKARLYGYEWR